MDDSTTHYSVGGVLVTVGGLAFFAHAYAGTVAVAGMLIIWRGVRLARAERSGSPDGEVRVTWDDARDWPNSNDPMSTLWLRNVVVTNPTSKPIVAHLVGYWHYEGTEVTVEERDGQGRFRVGEYDQSPVIPQCHFELPAAERRLHNLKFTRIQLSHRGVRVVDALSGQRLGTIEINDGRTWRKHLRTFLNPKLYPPPKPSGGDTEGPENPEAGAGDPGT